MVLCVQGLCTLKRRLYQETAEEYSDPLCPNLPNPYEILLCSALPMLNAKAYREPPTRGHSAFSESQQGGDAVARLVRPRTCSIRKMWIYPASITCMFDREATNVAVLVQVKQRIFIQIFGLSYLNRTKLNVQRVSLFENI